MDAPFASVRVSSLIVASVGSVVGSGSALRESHLGQVGHTALLVAPQRLHPVVVLLTSNGGIFIGVGGVRGTGVGHVDRRSLLALLGESSQDLIAGHRLGVPGRSVPN